MGLISELPVNQRNAYKITESHMNDPYKLAKAINDSDYEDDHDGNGRKDQHIDNLKFSIPASRMQGKSR
jgi:hypothetical protein